MFVRFKNVVLCSVVLLIVFAVGGCSKVEEVASNVMQGKIQTGTWSENGEVFVNDWLGLKLVLTGTDFYAYTPQELKELMGASEDILVNDGGVSQREIDMANLRTVYDFMVTTDYGIPNIMLMYENVNIPGLNNITESEYFDVLKENLQSQTVVSYSNFTSFTGTIAGDDWFVGKSTLEGGIAYQEFYMKKIDNVMVIFGLTYSPETKEDADELIALITKR